MEGYHSFVARILIESLIKPRFSKTVKGFRPLNCWNVVHGLSAGSQTSIIHFNPSRFFNEVFVAIFDGRDQRGGKEGRNGINQLS